MKKFFPLILRYSNTPNFLRPCTQGKRQHKDMKFWNWGPTTIWHNCMSLILKVKKSLHPNAHAKAYEKTYLKA